MYEVYRSAVLDKKLERCSKEIEKWIKSVEYQVSNNPYVGDPLGVRWIREKKMKKWRVYFVIYEDISAVYIVDLSDKKKQQEVINLIKLLKNELKEQLEQLRKRRRSSANSSNTSLKNIFYSMKKTLFIILAKILEFFNFVSMNCLHHLLNFPDESRA